MSAGGLKWSDFPARLEAGWRWWLSEIAALIPQKIRRALTSPDPAIVMDVQDDGMIVRRIADDSEIQIAQIPGAAFDAATLSRVVAPYLSKRWFLQDNFVLRIPAAMALRRTLYLPRAARRNLADILRFELDRQSPIGRDEVYYDFRTRHAASNTERIDVEMRIARREAIDSALAVCRQAGIGIAAVVFAGDEQAADGGNFPVDPNAAMLLRIRKNLVPGLAALACVLAIAVLAGVYLRNQVAADELAGRVEQARLNAQTVMYLDRKIEGARTRAAFLVHEKQNLLVVRLLAEVSRILPDGSWLSELELHDGEIRIQGLSNSAASLIGLFDASALFSDAQFRSPLVQPPGTNLERFDMSFKIRGGAS